MLRQRRRRPVRNRHHQHGRERAGRHGGPRKADDCGGNGGQSAQRRAWREIHMAMLPYPCRYRQRHVRRISSNVSSNPSLRPSRPAMSPGSRRRAFRVSTAIGRRVREARGYAVQSAARHLQRDLDSGGTRDPARHAMPETAEAGRPPAISTGRKPGDQAEVMPDDYGKIAVRGEIVALASRHIAIRRRDPIAGAVVVHLLGALRRACGGNLNRRRQPRIVTIAPVIASAATCPRIANQREPFDLVARYAAMAKTTVKVRSPARSRAKKSRASEKSGSEKSERKIGIRRGRRGGRRPRRAAAARGRRARSGDVAGRSRAGAQGLSADAVLDQRARLLGQEAATGWPGCLRSGC